MDLIHGDFIYCISVCCEKFNFNILLHVHDSRLKQKNVVAQNIISMTDNKGIIYEKQRVFTRWLEGFCCFHVSWLSIYRLIT